MSIINELLFELPENLLSVCLDALYHLPFPNFRELELPGVDDYHLHVKVLVYALENRKILEKLAKTLRNP